MGLAGPLMARRHDTARGLQLPLQEVSLPLERCYILLCLGCCILSRPVAELERMGLGEQGCPRQTSA
jgi:hypothetical protein